MKKLVYSIGLLFTLVFTVQSSNIVLAANTGDASEVNMKIYKLWVSPNTDCSDATMVFQDASPVAQNMITNPTFGNATLPNGTYPCIVLKMSDLITGKPAYTSTAGNCTPSTNISIDVFRADNNDTSTCPDGSVVTGTGTNASGAEDGPCLFMATTGSNSNVGWRANSPFPLTAPLVVNGNLTGTFVSDFRGKIQDAHGACGIEPPVFGFQ